MRLTIHALIAALASADVWDTREIDASPVPETMATLREYARALTLRGEAAEQLTRADDAPLTRRG